MCGICGVFHFDAEPVDGRHVERMADQLIHRGPDQGSVIAHGCVALGNRRLAILDLSPSGALPMRSSDGRLTLAYNGEVYNYPSLKRMLEAQGELFVSSSDAEAILKLYQRHGVQMLQYLRGMFAFGLWDSETQSLLLARDRMGEKPLYYYTNGRMLVFASEIKALLAYPGVPRESAIDKHLLSLYLAYGYIPTPLTAFTGIRVLPPGHWLQVRDGKLYTEAYWSPQASAGPENISSIRHYQDQVVQCLEDSVRQAMLSDVPLGAFLSGGLDSSLIVALMQRATNHSVRTFSIGFEGGEDYDETRFARQVAQHLETEHTAFTVQPQSLELAPKLVWHHDQPFGDSSAIPTYLVSRLAREQVTVALTGDGGDELFAGYDRFRAFRLIQHLKPVPKSLLQGADAFLRLFSEGTRYSSTVRRMRRFVRGSTMAAPLAYFDWIRLYDAGLASALLGEPERATRHFEAYFAEHGFSDEVSGILDYNLRTYLPDDLLIKTDRSSMAVSLETRAPFLDHQFYETVARIPLNLKLKGLKSKWILKEVARDFLPDSIIDRPKHGFGVPLGAWLRRDMSTVKEILLSPEAQSRGLLNVQKVGDIISEHMTGKRDHGQRLWSLVTLEWWHRLYIDPPQLAAP